MQFLAPSDSDYALAKEIVRGERVRTPAFEEAARAIEDELRIPLVELSAGFEPVQFRPGEQEPVLYVVRWEDSSRNDPPLPPLPVTTHQADSGITWHTIGAREGAEDWIERRVSEGRRRHEQILTLVLEHVPREHLVATLGPAANVPLHPFTRPPIGLKGSSFGHTARLELRSKVSETEQAEFERGLGLADELWLVDYMTGSPGVFLRTREQAERVVTSGEADRWSDLWFETIKPLDEFGVFRKSDVAVEIHSEEEFETTYKGRWDLYMR